jgi:hypothetical protein
MCAWQAEAIFLQRMWRAVYDTAAENRLQGVCKGAVYASMAGINDSAVRNTAGNV